MKKHFVCIVICAILVSCNQQSSTEVIITGKIEGLADSTIVELFEDNSDIPFMVDTAFNETFKFIFQDTAISELRTIDVVVNTGRVIETSARMWVQAGTKIEISGKDRYSRTWNIESAVPEQQEENKYREKNRAHYIRLDEVGQVLDSILPIIMYTTDELKKQQSIHTLDSLHKIRQPITYSIFKNELELLENGATHSKFWFLTLLKHAEFSHGKEEDSYPDANRLVTIYNELSEEQKNNAKAMLAAKFLFPPTMAKEGDKMADADLYNIDGNIQHLANYTGKYRLIDFWATWCAPCIAAIPEMNEIAEKYKKILVIIAINSEDKQVWTEFSETQETAGINLYDAEGEVGLTLNYGINSLPSYVLIDPNDQVIAIWAGYYKGSLHLKMQELLELKMQNSYL